MESGWARWTPTTQLFLDRHPAVKKWYEVDDDTIMFTFDPNVLDERGLEFVKPDGVRFDLEEAPEDVIDRAIAL